MKILAIHDGHISTACLIEDGKITSIASEERFTKIKNHGGFPVNALKWLLKEFNVNLSHIDYIVFPGLIDPIPDINSYNVKRHKWYNIASRYLPSFLMSSVFLTKLYLKWKSKKRRNLKLCEEYFKELKLENNKVKFIEHHTCHASTAYFLDNNFNKERKVLIFTLDGSGDGLSGSVNIGYKYKLERIAAIPSYHSLGILYSRVTSFLGMKPLEHEYKLMGMAPYAPEFHEKKSFDVFKTYLKLSNDGLSFQNTSGVWGDELMRKFQKDLFTHRFDGICAGLQHLTEELTLTWILNWINKTGLNEICVAGGVFMNVKLNMLINEHPDVKSVFFMPSCGDESIAIGAAYYQYACSEKEENIKISPLTNLFFGPSYTNEEIEIVLKNNAKNIKYRKFDDINSKVVELLMRGKIIGRMNGRMEFGARSLGNRAIIANPNNYGIVGKLNRAIKMRDFWMPFAPSILDTYADVYLNSTKTKKAPYMILGFETKEKARTDIPAGLHQSDFSCRPQIVEEKANPEYYDLLMKFEKASGIGGILNTSFNIHGYPIINSPEDALWTLHNSGLDAIQIRDFLIEKE